MKAIADSSISKDADKIKQQFHTLLAKANKEDPRPTDVKALSDLLYKNKDMKLWHAIIGMGALVEHMALIQRVGSSCEEDGMNLSTDRCNKAVPGHRTPGRIAQSSRHREFGEIQARLTNHNLQSAI